jgi:mannose-6-phosphate isomerase
MTSEPLYPLSFEPLFQYRPWGGRRLEAWMNTPLPGEGPVGEAWILSDRDAMPSRVAAGPLKGTTLRELIAATPEAILGAGALPSTRFPLLIKYLDVAGLLSVQVHPPDSRTDLIPPGDTGKTEAWVILDADPGARIYAGLNPGTTLADLGALTLASVETHLARFTPERAQAVLIEAGVVHAIGEGLLVLEVQENSDVTFRLYDWDRVDPTTGHTRALQVEQALACVDPFQGAIAPRTFSAAEDSFGSAAVMTACPHFTIRRFRDVAPFPVGAVGAPRLLVCVEGTGSVEHLGADIPMRPAGLVLLPAALGVCGFRPNGPVTVLEIAGPDPGPVPPP